MLDQEAAEDRADRQGQSRNPAQVPIALPRSWAGKASVMIESVPGIMKAAPTP